MTKTKTKYIDNFVNKIKTRLKRQGGTSGEESHFMFGCSQVLRAENSRSTSSQRVAAATPESNQT